VNDQSEPCRVVLVTGAGRGIGAAVARRLAADGHAVVGFDRCADDPALPYPLATRAELDDVMAKCGPHAVAVEGDVRDQAALDAAVALACDRFGGLDAAVACAGVIAGGDPAWVASDDVWQVNVDVNLTGVWRTAKAVVPALLERAEPRSGRFVAVASAAGTGGHPAIAAYSAAKHGVIGFVRSIAVELGPLGITANAVCPGSTSTEILEASREFYDLHSAGEFAVHHPIGRLLQPDEIASAVAWLCGEEQSGVTGIALAVDGGMTI
jgi:SDR family mycofactocin-dependent oxidoreductase